MSASSNARGSAAPTSVERELVITRLFDAPRDLVFKAWTDPKHLVRWWGPRNFTIPFCKIDLRPGGVMHYCMRSPQGQDFWAKGIYREIAVPERIVVTDFFSDEAGNLVDPAQYGMSSDFPVERVITVTFTERDGKTLVTMHQTIAEPMAQCMGAVQGWNESFDKLAEELSKKEN